MANGERILASILKANICADTCPIRKNCKLGSMTDNPICAREADKVAQEVANLKSPDVTNVVQNHSTSFNVWVYLEGEDSPTRIYLDDGQRKI